MVKAKHTKRSALSEVVTRECTIHLSKMVRGVQFKKRTPKAMDAIRKYVRQDMGTTEVRIDPGLNKFLWSTGVKAIPSRLRIRMSRKRSDEDDSANKLYTVVTYVPVASFKGLETEVVDEEE
ncbi:60S ribosomal protein L31 [Dimargaris cristalligena]|uniref:Ribosomal protein L31e n=1 Tax=Dimargaris cristalligena TaxID=215637 RepID=A0A4P9ZRT5_9FUNG|nr:60S ribosomal protein L31 [Dimargaris cristalligena]RKP35888.1 ribosomal protein L31e [Dimargaris cristalligena]|eukprot:RKP35888.1 ribosomal protein L31e [Dimargaris cristalligena]